MFNQKIINIQTQFLAHVASEKGAVKVQFTEPHAKNFTDFGKIVIAGAGAGGGGAALAFITVGTAQVAVAPAGAWAAMVAWVTGPAMVAQPVSLAAWLAGVLGVSTSVATAILSGGVGLLAIAGVYALFLPIWRRRMRKKLLEDFDIRILPMLRDWADDVVRQANAN